MNEISDAYKRQIERQFHNFCVTVLKNEASDIRDEYARQKEKEIFLEDMTVKELLELSVFDELESPTVFAVGEDLVLIQNEELADALKHLTDRKRELILLYFFLDKTDREIAFLYDMVRQTVTYQRKSILKQLKQYLEEGKL